MDRYVIAVSFVIQIFMILVLETIYCEKNKKINSKYTLHEQQMMWQFLKFRAPY